MHKYVTYIRYLHLVLKNNASQKVCLFFPYFLFEHFVCSFCLWGLQKILMKIDKDLPGGAKLTHRQSHVKATTCVAIPWEGMRN